MLLWRLHVAGKNMAYLGLQFNWITYFSDLNQMRIFWKGFLQNNSSFSSSGATTSLFESFDLLNYFPPFNQILGAFCSIIYFYNS